MEAMTIEKNKDKTGSLSVAPEITESLMSNKSELKCQ